jgi:hypothetical protein
MAELLKAGTVAEGWTRALDHLLEVGGSDANLIVELQSTRDIPIVRDVLDNYVAALNNTKLASATRVADTIFPIDYYKGTPGLKARNHVYKMQRLSATVEHRFVGDCYFDRLIDWPYCLPDGKVASSFNQLEFRIRRLIKAWDGNKRTMNDAELAVSAGAVEEHLDFTALATGDMRVQHPTRDHTPIGFPCLSHVSLTLHKGRLDLTATYRNQHFISKAYGNYLGLARLLTFIASEVGCEEGSVVCIATHADGEFNKNGNSVRAVRALLNRCIEARSRWDGSDRSN